MCVFLNCMALYHANRILYSMYIKCQLVLNRSDRRQIEKDNPVKECLTQPSVMMAIVLINVLYKAIV